MGQDKSTSIAKNTFKPFSKKDKFTAKRAFILNRQATTIVAGSKNLNKMVLAFSEREKIA